MIAVDASRVGVDAASTSRGEILAVIATWRTPDRWLPRLAAALGDHDGRATVLIPTQPPAWWAFALTCGVAVPNATRERLIEAIRHEISEALAGHPELGESTTVAFANRPLTIALPHWTRSGRFGHVLVAMGPNRREQRLAERIRAQAGEWCSAQVVSIA